VRTRAAADRIDPRSPSSAAAAYVRDLRVRRRSESLAVRAERVLPRFFDFLAGRRVRDLRAVTEDHLVAYALKLSRMTSERGRPFEVTTQRTYMDDVVRFFRFLEQRRVLLRDPGLDLELPRVSGLPKVVLTEAQARRLVEAPELDTLVGVRNRALLETLYGTGIRLTECARLELRDVDLTRGTLFVRQGKGKKDRVVPIAGRAAEAMDRYLSEVRPELLRDPRQQAVFLSYLQNPGMRMTRGTIALIVRRAARAAQLPVDVSTHTLRHSFATHLIQGGADVRHVQKLLGHADIRSTSIYTRVMPRDLGDVLRRAHPREKAWTRRQRKRRQ
jgi:integrase/recombinase XerD